MPQKIIMTVELTAKEISVEIYASLNQPSWLHARIEKICDKKAIVEPHIE